MRFLSPAELPGKLLIFFMHVLLAEDFHVGAAWPVHAQISEDFSDLKAEWLLEVVHYFSIAIRSGCFLLALAASKYSSKEPIVRRSFISIASLVLRNSQAVLRICEISL